MVEELTRLGVVTDEEIRTEGLKITTTIDPQVQNAAVKAANGKLEGEPDNLRDAVVSIEPKTGAVRGYFGGNDGQGWDYSFAGGSADRIVVQGVRAGRGPRTGHSAVPGV